MTASDSLCVVWVLRNVKTAVENTYNRKIPFSNLFGSALKIKTDPTFGFPSQRAYSVTALLKIDQNPESEK